MQVVPGEGEHASQLQLAQYTVHVQVFVWPDADSLLAVPTGGFGKWFGRAKNKVRLQKQFFPRWHSLFLCKYCVSARFGPFRLSELSNTK